MSKINLTISMRVLFGISMVIYCVATSTSAASEYYNYNDDSQLKEEGYKQHGIFSQESKAGRCYQCAYTPAKTEVEEVKIPRTVREEVLVPKVVTYTVTVPRVSWVNISRPREIFEEEPYYDAATWQWKVGRQSRTVYEVVWVSKLEKETKVVTKQVTNKEVVTKKVFDVKKIKTRKAGGWDKCLGPFTTDQARMYGIDEWQCDGNCYIRIDANGNVLRGCYHEEYNVDPSKVGCHLQAGSTYCFCKGDRCNNGEIPEALVK